jgi:hypothetical protein
MRELPDPIPSEFKGKITAVTKVLLNLTNGDTIPEGTKSHKFKEGSIYFKTTEGHEIGFNSDDLHDCHFSKQVE